jgi:predicted nuclease of predicted toxin-antitoxin system
MARRHRELSPAWVELFVAAGFQAIHWSKIGPHEASDLELIWN